MLLLFILLGVSLIAQIVFNSFYLKNSGISKKIVFLKIEDSFVIKFFNFFFFSKITKVLEDEKYFEKINNKLNFM